jgi:excinuclease ABC subunit C
MTKANKPSDPLKIQDSFTKEIIDPNFKGQEIIKFIAKTLPQKPGVYQMENEKGDILYIGKAKNLAKRVINYTSLNNLTRRLQRMVNLTKQMNFVVTNTEVEALLLECNLIKRHKPRFNIILRDDKSFPYILINKEYEFPRIQKYRGAKKFKGDYYGPFVSPSVANYTLLSLQKAFLLRSCSDTVFQNRKRPCLLFDIKRCSAPCVGYVPKETYSETIKDAKKFLSGNTKRIENKLTKMMIIASKKQMFEEAGRLRDRIKSINQIQKYQSVYIKDMRNIDIFAIKILEGKSCIHGKFYRNGSNYGNKSFFPIHENSALENEILESFFYQFYSDKDVPPKILINQNPKYFREVENILNSKSNNKTKIIQPKTGEKYKHILLAEKNASENIKLKKASLQNHQEALNKLQKLLKLKMLPVRIEVYDNSHTFGKESVGAMIVVDSEGLSPKNYRKYNIRYDQNKKQPSSVDDYYMMTEVLKRRLKIRPNSENIIPNIIIIDGGRGQYNAAKKILDLKKFEKISLISVSKGRDRNAGREIIHLKNRNINLPPNDPLLFFIQRIRDEAHRFAITAHRTRRGKKSVESIFSELAGIGPKRKKLLMIHFGSIEKIKNASKNELLSINGIPKGIINKLYDFFHSQ